MSTGGQLGADKGKRGHGRDNNNVRRGPANNAASETKGNDVSTRNSQDRMNGAIEASMSGKPTGTSALRNQPQRRPSYADAVRRNSGQSHPTNGGPVNGPGTFQVPNVINVEPETKSNPSVVGGPDIKQASSQPLSRVTSHRSADSGYSFARNGPKFRDPFDEKLPAIRVSRSEGEAFATGFAKQTQDLEDLTPKHRDTSEAFQAKEEAAKKIATHRSTLCKAVVILTEQNSLTRLLCDYTAVRETLSGRRAPGPRRFTLKGSKDSVVPFQRIHEGPFTIDRKLANTLYYNSGSDAEKILKSLLRELNNVLGTEYALEKPGLQACLQGYLDESCDFGQIYGHLRPWWFRGNFDRITTLMQARKEEDALLRKNAVDGDCIINPHVPPRRVWDLFSNRVLPFHVLPVSPPSMIPSNVWAVSHSWKDNNERDRVATGINGFAWRVPMPINTDLHDLRIELLNLGAEYVFLDILCLRQEDYSKPGQEFRRKKEWRLDVPTIGYVYQHPRITVIYFNGLGEEFKLEPKGGFTAKYHWFQRVWTLQEATEYWLPGGLTQTSLHAVYDRNAAVEASAEFSDRLHETLRSTSITAEVDMFTLFEAMRTRQYANKVDAVAGLAYLLKCKTLPIYNADSQDMEGAWEALIQSMSPLQRLLLLVCWGRAGSSLGLYTWRPTWEELHGCVFPLHLLNLPSRYFQQNDDECLQFLPDAGHQEGSDAYFHYAYVMDPCMIQFNKSSRQSSFIPDRSETVTSPISMAPDYGDESYESDSTVRNSSPLASSKATRPAVVKVWSRTNRSYAFPVAKFIEPFQINGTYSTDILMPAFTDDQHSASKKMRPLMDEQEHECVLVGVFGCRYWIVGLKTGSRRIGSVKRVTVLSKIAVVMLAPDHERRTPDKENLCHVDIVAYR